MPTYTDGSILKGGFTITLTTAGTTFIVDTATRNGPSKTIQRYDSSDAPAASLVYDDFVTGTATIQVNATADRGDFRGDTFSTDAFIGSSETFIINSCNQGNTKDQMVTYEIGFIKAYN